MTENATPAPAPAPAGSRRRGHRALIAAVVVAALLGAMVAVGGFYVASVDLGPPLTYPATTTVYYADGTVLAELGEIRRYPLAYGDLAPVVTQATAHSRAHRLQR